MNHHLLCAIGVGHHSLDIVAAVSAAMGFACKLTGAGGGGCAITVVTPQEDKAAMIREFSERLVALSKQQAVISSDRQEYNFEVLETKIGGEGVLWH